MLLPFPCFHNLLYCLYPPTRIERGQRVKMGVPSFYRWLVNKYPKIVVNAIEEKGEFIDPNLQNKNGEFDNFYIDMNGIIHPCFHPDDKLFPPTTFDEVFDNICEYIDRLFNIVRPRKLLYLAIDGVAPRAKMNQQRARRFRASKDNQIAEEMEETLRKQFEKEGKTVLPKEESKVSDSNVITPGTEFMYMLSTKLESYIRQRISGSATWSNFKVILSDANVPGEGEHKIMSFIRAQRLLPGYDANTRHCLYGLDADLIMLALATHELYFSIIREDVLVQEEQLCRVSALEHSVHGAEVSSLEKSVVLNNAVHTDNKRSKLLTKPFQFLHVWILREYLELDMDMDINDLPENFVCDFERIIDDFVFICFFAGNDFLPHLPTLEIHEGAIDLLMHVYKREFKKMGGYLVDSQKVNEKNATYIKLKRVEKFMFYIGQYEDQIFTKRSRLKEKRLKHILAECMDDQIDEEEENEEGVLNTTDALLDVNPESSQIDLQSVDKSQILRNTKELKQKLKDQIRGLADTFKNGGLGTDKVKLGLLGWKKRYYKEKFSSESPGDIETTRKELVRNYGEGLCWVLLYYFSGVPSWTWFYPYYYAPFASDFKGLSQVQVNFRKGLPFKPFDQLMGVLPPRSAHALPVAYKGLMVDESSKIIDFYPAEFETDIDGKRYMWQGICKLPFIDEERLLTETMKVQKELKDFEIMRNTENPDKVFARSSSKFGREIRSCCGSFSMEDEGAIKIDCISSEQINSFMHMKSEDLAEVDNEDCTPTVLCVLYETPQQCQLIPKLLPGVEIPDCKTVYEADIPETNLWHEHWGSNSHYNRRVNNQERPRKDYSRVESEYAFPEVICKNAGTGYSFGRGNNNGRHGNFPGHAVSRPFIRNSSPISSDARAHMVSSRGWHSNSREGLGQPPFGTNHPRHNNSGSGVPNHIGQFKGIEGLQISEVPVPKNFWPSNSPYNAGHYSRLNNRPTAAPHGQVWRGWENTGQTWRHNQFLPTNSPAQGGWPRMSTENASQTRQHNQSMPTNSAYRGGCQRMHTENTSQTLWHNQRMPTSSAARGVWPRMPTENTSQTYQPAGRGRGWQRMPTENTSQTCRPTGRGRVWQRMPTESTSQTCQPAGRGRGWQRMPTENH